MGEEGERECLLVQLAGPTLARSIARPKAGVFAGLGACGEGVIGEARGGGWPGATVTQNRFQTQGKHQLKEVPAWGAFGFGNPWGPVGLALFLMKGPSGVPKRQQR